MISRPAVASAVSAQDEMNLGFTPLTRANSTALFLASGSESVFLLQKNLHVLKVKSHRVGLEEIVADHAREVKAKHVFPRERSIVEARDVLFLYISEGKLTHGGRHDFQFPASAGSFRSFVFLELDPGFLDNRLGQFNTRARQSCVNEEERGRKCLDATPAHHEVVARHPDWNRDFLA